MFLVLQALSVTPQCVHNERFLSTREECRLFAELRNQRFVAQTNESSSAKWCASNGSAWTHVDAVACACDETSVPSAFDRVNSLARGTLSLLRDHMKRWVHADVLPEEASAASYEDSYESYTESHASYAEMYDDTYDTETYDTEAHDALHAVNIEVAQVAMRAICFFDLNQLDFSPWMKDCVELVTLYRRNDTQLVHNLTVLVRRVVGRGGCCPYSLLPETETRSWHRAFELAVDRGSDEDLDDLYYSFSHVAGRPNFM